MNNKAIVNKFLTFVVEHLGIEKCPIITLTSDREGYGLETTAYYDIRNRRIVVYIKGRALIDIFRSIAHELVHHQQNERGDLSGNIGEGDDGSIFENEANAKAGEIIRIFGRQNTELYH